MQLAQVGVWPAHASGTVTQVGLRVGSLLPPSGGSVPGYCPKLMHSSPDKHFRSPQEVPHVPGLDTQNHFPVVVVTALHVHVT